MKRALLVSAVFCAFLLGDPANLIGPHAAGSTLVRAAAAHDLDDEFDEALSPYGDWTTMQPYGRVWYPRGVRRDWRPYRDGHWAYAEDAGWVWVADEPWGWAPYHYGRWVFTDALGWVWVPGHRWAPAWVSFRFGGGYVGWAPLAARPGWDDDDFQPNYDDGYDADPSEWCFVPEDEFLAPRIAPAVIVERRNVVNIIHVTKNVTNITVINNRIVNRGIDVDRIERDGHRPVIRYRTVDADAPSKAHVRGRDLAMFRPQGQLERHNGNDGDGQHWPAQNAHADDQPNVPDAGDANLDTRHRQRGIGNIVVKTPETIPDGQAGGDSHRTAQQQRRLDASHRQKQWWDQQPQPDQQVDQQPRSSTQQQKRLEASQRRQQWSSQQPQPDQQVDQQPRWMKQQQKRLGGAVQPQEQQPQWLQRRGDANFDASQQRSSQVRVQQRSGVPQQAQGETHRRQESCPPGTICKQP